MFSHSEGCCFTFLIVFHEGQKQKILMKSNLCIFLLSHVLMVLYLKKKQKQKNHGLSQEHKDLHLECFLVRVYSFRSMIHFESILYPVTSCLSLSLFVLVQLHYDFWYTNILGLFFRGRE